MTVFCSGCNRPLDIDPPDLCAQFGGALALIVDALEQSEKGLTIEELACIAYRDGTALTPRARRDAIHQNISRARRALREQGFDITHAARFTGRYRLVRTGPAPEPGGADD